MPTHNSRPITLSVPCDALQSIEVIAEATGKSTSDIIVRALWTYLLNEGADVLSAVRGWEQIASGEFEDIDDLIADVDDIIASSSL